MSEKPTRVGENAYIYKRGNVWWIGMQINNRQVRQTLRTRNQKEARRLAVEMEVRVLRGDTPHKNNRSRQVTLAEVVRAYLDHCEAVDRAPRTLVKYRGILSQVIIYCKLYGLMEIRQLDHLFIDKLRATRKVAGRSPKTIYTEVVVIRQLLLFAQRRGLIDHDPLTGLQIPKPKATPQPCWTAQQVEQILSASAEPHRSVFVLLAETGLRIGELQWLTWDDIDLGNNVVHVRPKRGWSTKTGNYRRVPLSGRAKETFCKLPRKWKWVVTAPASAKYPQGDRQISERRLLRVLKRLLKKLELNGHLHTFRHSFISRAVINGVPEAVIRQWVGHVDPRVLQLYTHIADAQSQQAMARLGECQ